MRAAILFLVVAGCKTNGSTADLGNQLSDGFFASEDLSMTLAEDLARSVDFSGADLRGADFSTAPADLASPQAGDMAIRADGSVSVTTPDTCAAAVALVSGIEVIDQDNTGL